MKRKKPENPLKHTYWKNMLTQEPRTVYFVTVLIMRVSGSVIIGASVISAVAIQSLNKRGPVR